MYRVFSLDLLSIIVYIKYMKTTKGENTMNIEKLDDKVKKLLDDTESKMFDLIEEYNESIEDNEDVSEVDTVDLSSKFDDLKDYVSDYGE